MAESIHPTRFAGRRATSIAPTRPDARNVTTDPGSSASPRSTCSQADAMAPRTTIVTTRRATIWPTLSRRLCALRSAAPAVRCGVRPRPGVICCLLHPARDGSVTAPGIRLGLAKPSEHIHSRIHEGTVSVTDPLLRRDAAAHEGAVAMLAIRRTIVAYVFARMSSRPSVASPSPQRTAMGTRCRRQVRRASRSNCAPLMERLGAMFGSSHALSPTALASRTPLPAGVSNAPLCGLPQGSRR